MAKKYTLPEVESLKQIGFRFEFNTINELFTYTKNFVTDHDDELIHFAFPNFDTDHYFDCNDQEWSYNMEIWDIEKRIKRLRKGRVQKDDYQFVVHPVWSNDTVVLIRAWEKKKEKFGIDSGELFYYQKAYRVDYDFAIPATLLNWVYRELILALTGSRFNAQLNDHFVKYQDQIDTIKLRHDPEQYPVNSRQYNFKWMVKQHHLERVKGNIYEDMFEKPLTAAERATFLFRKIKKHPQVKKINQATSIEDKEKVLRYYLRQQTPEVQKSKNSNGTRTHAVKKQKIIDYFIDNPNASISEAARTLGMDRKTIRKHKP